MDRPTATATVALVVAIFAALTAMFLVFAPGVATPQQRGAEFMAAQAADEQALLLNMVLFQRYLEKAQAAAEAGNWPLAAMYAHEIEENAEWVVDAAYLHDGIDISAIAAEVALPRAERLLAAAEAGGPEAFRVAHGEMIVGCNTCHRRSGNRIIQVAAPAPGAAAAAYPSQNFAPIPPTAGQAAGAPEAQAR